MPGILGSLISGGLNLIGAGIAARRNRVAQGQLDTIQGQNTDILNNFEQKYGTTFDPSTARATTGANMYGDATGVNGQAGYDRATAAFRAGPGYQFAVDQGLQAVGRQAAAAGMSASGNALLEAQRVGQGMADQEFQRYIGNLSPWVGQEQAGLENQAALGSLISTGRLENNNARAEGLQAGINGRQNAIGGMLSNAGSAFGQAAGYGAYNKQPTQPATGGGGLFQNIRNNFFGAR